MCSSACCLTIDTRDVNVSVAGYVSGNWNGAELVALGSVSVSVAAALIARAATHA